MLRYTLVLAMLAVWAVALEAWPALPERIPMHFDAAGRPDGWVAKSVFAWFSLPALATAMGLGLGVLLPRWTLHLARRGSPYLNLPHKERFLRLPEAARMRAMRPTATGLAAIAVLLQGLFGTILWGSARVATGAAEVLAPWPAFVMVGGTLLVAGWICFVNVRAVRAELAAHGL